MQLTANETTLLEAFRPLPANAADELSSLVQRLAAGSPETQIDWSDAWSEEDLNDFRAQSIEGLETDEKSR
jgi:hypothetical protein